jgi:2-dehydropantoate 2-reductase
MNIIVIGQGAMGLLWYHHILQLLESDCDYSNDQLHLLPSNRTPSNRATSDKLKLSVDHYSFTDQHNLAHHEKVNYAQVEDIRTADIILVCLKSFQISSALKNISSQLNKYASIVLAHNGMGTLTELPKSIIDKHNIYILLTTHGCLRSAPLTIIHTGIGTTDIGLVSGTSDLEQQRSVTQLLDAALPKVKYHKEIKQKQWLKLAINCVINPLTALNNINNGEINNAVYAKNTIALLEEVITVAGAEGLELNLGELKKTVEKVVQATAINSSSMRCDILANRKSEIDYINGYIHRLGIKHNIATPENTKMWQQVKSLGPRT